MPCGVRYLSTSSQFSLLRTLASIKLLRLGLLRLVLRVLHWYRRVCRCPLRLLPRPPPVRTRTFLRSGRYPSPALLEPPTPCGGPGLSVCYDLRFPELYRQMAAAGARFLAVPSAFTPHTGKDHWEVLLRARAIENQAFVLAPAQAGRHSPERASHGRSMIIDPWGLVLAQAADRPDVLLADCRLEDLERIRSGLPALAHRRL